MVLVGWLLHPVIFMAEVLVTCYTRLITGYIKRIYGQFCFSSSPNLHDFGLLDVTRTAGGKPHKHIQFNPRQML